MDPNRRRLLKALAAAPLAAAGTNRFAFAADGGTAHTVVVVFLRGAMDSVGALIPSDESAYYDKRPGIHVPRAGQVDLNGRFALHDALRPLKDIYDQGNLAFVVGTGLDSASSTRSHFDAQARMEGGLSGQASAAEGWLGRYLALRADAEDAVFRGVSIAGLKDSIRGYGDALNINNLADLRLRSPDGVTAYELDATLENMYTDTSNALLRQQSERALNTLYLATVRNLGYGIDAAAFGPRRFGREMRQVAELIEADIGLAAATVDMGGWDLHDSYGSWRVGAMQGRLKQLGEGLAAFHDAIRGRSDVTVVVMSEFGRRLEENSSYGTDHGKGGMMMVMGGGVNGGRVAGPWSGLGSLDDGDLPVTTDYRQVLGELLARRLGSASDLDAVFPGYQAPGWLDLFV